MVKCGYEIKIFMFLIIKIQRTRVYVYDEGVIKGEFIMLKIINEIYNRK